MGSVTQFLNITFSIILIRNTTTCSLDLFLDTGGLD